MANFENGVKEYVRGYAVVMVNFPVDFRGNADITCYQCQFYNRSSGRCLLNNSVPEYPQKYTGSNCPLEPVEEVPKHK